ncbi:MAG: hypothetical protein Q4B15_01975 [Lachnospiraceae bacterium]|nr:hypothetical protein [Lachnospiraceae bacterium]
MTDWLSERKMTSGGLTLEDLSGHSFWRELLLGSVPERAPKEGMLSFADWLRMPGQHSFCLCGESGMGKHTLAGAYAGSMIARGRQAYYLREKDLLCEDMEDRVATLFSRLVSEGALLIQDNITDRDLWERMTLETSYLDAESGVFVLFIESDEDILNLDPVSGILYCPLSAPDTDDRIAFFKENENRFPANRKLTDDKKAELTAGLNYRELTTLVQFIKLSIMQEAVSSYQSVQEAREQGFQKGAGPLGMTEEKMRGFVKKVKEPIGRKVRNAAAQIQAMAIPQNAVVIPEYTGREIAEINQMKQKAFSELDAKNEIEEIDTTTMEGAAQAAFAELD